METFEGRVAVVTGAASGIGRGLAERFASEGMRLVLADVEEAPLRALEEQLLERGVEAVALRADVRKESEVEEVQRAAIDAFGRVHVLCNNAGVGSGGLTWETSREDWEWVLGVNLWGVIHGVRTFLPGMLAHGEEGHIVNTASMAGLVAAPFMGPYNVSKYGVVALSETLYQELAGTGAKIGVSVLCPGFVSTRIHESGRNRPPELMTEPEDAERGPAGPAMQSALAGLVAAGMAPAAVAERVFASIREQRFYVLTHPEMKPAIAARMEAILEERAPAAANFAQMSQGSAE